MSRDTHVLDHVTALNEEVTRPFPRSRKIHVPGSRPDLLVAMREVELDPTPSSFGAEENPPVTEINLNTHVNVTKHSWVAARSAGENYSYIPTYDGGQRGIMGHTSPIYLAVGGDWTMFDLATANYMLTLCSGGIEYIRTRAHQWPEGTVTHHHGNHDHQEFLEYLHISTEETQRIREWSREAPAAG